ncbi:MAG TPA: glycosyltransferase [Steroidobacteraceae bacterium]|nr:glycosyltransferase [Steroidobacteraceae bacterium]
MNQSQSGPMRISVIVPVGARQSEAELLYSEYQRPLVRRGATFEFIFVLDGPHPTFEAALERLAARGERFTVVTLTRSFGEATALMVGFEHAAGDLILTLPAYAQINAEEINPLLDKLGEADLVVSYRHPRRGSWAETLRRRMFHGLLGLVTHVRFNDLGCNARAMRRKVLEEIPLYGEQQRFLPVLADRQGFRVRELAVRQCAQDVRRDRTQSYARGILDIFNVFFLVRFTKKPLRFFGMIGVALCSLGALALLYLVFERLALDRSLADRPALMLASLFIVLGVQVFALGLLGELIIFAHAGGIKDYQVDRVIHFPAVASEPPPAHASHAARPVAVS